MTAAVFFNSASELATLSNTFRVDGVGTNPTTVTLTITSPSNVVTSPTPTSAGSGAYSADITCDEDGEWQYEWVGTGTATDTEIGTWFVQPTDLGRLYCPIGTLKSRLGISHTDADYELHAACFAASRWIEQYCDRTFWRSTSQTRTFEPNGLYYLKLPAFNDLVSVTTLKVDSAGDGTFATTWSASDYQLLPHNPDAAPEQLPYSEVRALTSTFPIRYGYGYGLRRDTVQIIGVWGWPKVPSAVRQAAAIVAADTFSLKDAPFGVVGTGDFNFRIGDNRRALQFLAPYRRTAVLVA